MTGQQPGDSASRAKETVPPQARYAAETMLPGHHDSVAESAQPGQQPGQEFGRYRLEECLGQGAMGAVYKAHDTQLDRVVAIKIPKFDTESGPDLLERFYREARSAATLSHAGICPVYDVGEIDGTHYISMGYIQGRPLTSFIKPEKPLSVKKAVTVVRKLAAALDEAHQHGVVHRDLKPDNVMIDRKSNPVIMDFGLAYRSSAGDSRMTQGGQIIGTPAYMSPEQVDADTEVMGPRSDVYSLGIILYELLTGRVPYDGTVARVLAQVIQGNPQPPTELRSDISTDLEAICLKMMAADPDDRYSSMAEVTKALTAFLKGHTSSDDSVAEPMPAAVDTATVRSSSVSQTADRKLPAWAIPAAAGVAGVVLLLGIVLFLQVGEQTVRVEIDDPDAVVFVDGNAVRIENLGATIELKPGDHAVEVKRGDISVLTRSFTVFDGENPALKLEVLDNELPDEPDTPVQVADSNSVDATPSNEATETTTTDSDPTESTVTTATPVSGSTLMICERMESKRAPISAHPSTQPFQGPRGDGRRGANGILIPAAPDGWRESGTEYRCQYTRSGHARFLMMWHPFQDGVMLVTIRDNFVNLYPGGVWYSYGGGRNQYPHERTEAFDETFPIPPGQKVAVRSRLFATGDYELFIDDRLVLTANFESVQPLELTADFQGAELAGKMPPGTAVVMVGPTDRGSAIAENVELHLLEGESPTVAESVTPIENPPETAVATTAASIPRTPAENDATVTSDGFTLDTPAKEVVGVWELHGAKTSQRIVLFKDGTTNTKNGWKPVTAGRIEFADGAGSMVKNGHFLLGQWRRGACLLMKRIAPIWIAGTTGPVPLPEPPDDRNVDFEENLHATFELTATNRRANQEFILPVTFSDDYRLLDRDRTIGTWTADGTKVSVEFLDAQLGTASLSPRSKDELRGASKAESGSAWSLELHRVKQMAVWETDRYGKVTLLSNGRLNDPTGAESPGFWWMDGQKMFINHFSCTASADGQTFNGRGQHAIGLNGKFVAGAAE